MGRVWVECVGDIVETVRKGCVESERKMWRECVGSVGIVWGKSWRECGESFGIVWG